MTKAPKFACACASAAWLWVPSSSGKPTDGGASGNVSHRNTTQPRAKPAGTRKHNRQLITTRKPHRTRISAAPRECDIFQIDHFVERSLGENQWVSSRAQGGKPIP